MNNQILNLNKNTINFDEDEDDENNNFDISKIHIIITQRNNRKFYTNIKGINTKYDYKLLLNELKKKFNTNGSIVTNKDTLVKSIQLNGDLKLEVKEFLINENISEQNNIIIKNM